MKRINLVLIVAVLLGFTQSLSAVEINKNIWISQVSAKGISFSPGPAVLCNVELSILMGEPLVNAKGLVVFDEQASYTVFYKEKKYKVPKGVIQEIEVISAKVSLDFSRSGFLDIDLGAMPPLYFGHRAGLNLLSLEELSELFSFNVSASPDWAGLFRLGGIAGKDKYQPKAEAKNLFKQLTSSDIIGLTARATLELNLQPLDDWLLSKKKKKKKVAQAKEPFDRFKRFDSDADSARIKEMDQALKDYMARHLGWYYVDVKVAARRYAGLTLTKEYMDDTDEERRERERQRKKAARERARKEQARQQRVKKAKAHAQQRLCQWQQAWKTKRDSLKPSARSYLLEKFNLDTSLEEVRDLIRDNFSSTRYFERTYVISRQGDPPRVITQ